jgi:hypothetical protein
VASGEYGVRAGSSAHCERGAKRSRTGRSGHFVPSSAQFHHSQPLSRALGWLGAYTLAGSLRILLASGLTSVAMPGFQLRPVPELERAPRLASWLRLEESLFGAPLLALAPIG